MNFEPASFNEGTPTLQMGENILAIHGLNETVSSSDFLAVPRLYSEPDAGGMVEIFRNDRHYFPSPTPGAPNVPGAPGVSPEPRFSEPDGAYPPGLEIVLDMENPVAGTEIRYTTDESVPTEESTLYTGPIAVNQEMVINARAFVPGLLPSEPSSKYYIILGNDLLNFDSTVPIVICSMAGPRTSRCFAEYVRSGPLRQRTRRHLRAWWRWSGAILGRPAFSSSIRVSKARQS